MLITKVGKRADGDAILKCQRTPRPNLQWVQLGREGGGGGGGGEEVVDSRTGA